MAEEFRERKKKKKRKRDTNMATIRYLVFSFSLSLSLIINNNRHNKHFLYVSLCQHNKIFNHIMLHLFFLASNYIDLYTVTQQLVRKLGKKC